MDAKFSRSTEEEVRREKTWKEVSKEWAGMSSVTALKMTACYTAAWYVENAKELRVLEVSLR